METNEKQWNKKEIKKNTSKLARGVLIYELMMFLIISVDMICRVILSSSNSQLDIDSIIDEAMNSGTSSIIAVFLGLLFLLFYFRECNYRKLIFYSQEKMTRVSFLILVTIFMSAVIFGAFHGNLIQSIFAILVGLVLGYVAMRYSIKWSILLHIINNFIFGDLLSYLTSNLNESMQSAVNYVLEGIFVVGTIAIILLKRNEMKKIIKDIIVEKGFTGINLYFCMDVSFFSFSNIAGNIRNRKTVGIVRRKEK